MGGTPSPLSGLSFCFPHEFRIKHQPQRYWGSSMGKPATQIVVHTRPRLKTESLRPSLMVKKCWKPHVFRRKDAIFGSSPIFWTPQHLNSTLNCHCLTPRHLGDVAVATPVIHPLCHQLLKAMKALHPRQAVFTRSALLAVFMDLICLKHVWSYSPGHSLMIFPALKLHSVRGFPSQRLSMAKDPKNWNTSKLENYLRCDVKTKKTSPVHIGEPPESMV